MNRPLKTTMLSSLKLNSLFWILKGTHLASWTSTAKGPLSCQILSIVSWWDAITDKLYSQEGSPWPQGDIYRVCCCTNKSRWCWLRADRGQHYCASSRGWAGGWGEVCQAQLQPPRGARRKRRENSLRLMKLFIKNWCSSCSWSFKVGWWRQMHSTELVKSWDSRSCGEAQI